ncbi:MAG TPA: chemotaxis protein CheA, partial [Geobacterales bacterium]|nr:chemotaxis protein CheA [Geobacterales bacterium]
MSNESVGKAVKDFIAEAEEIVEHLSADLLNLGDCADSGDCDPDIINAIFRGAHSLKGLAGMFGFNDIAELAHNLESLLDALRLGKTPLNQASVTLLLEAMDLLSHLVRSVATGGGGGDVTSVVSRINDCLQGRDSSVSDSPLDQLGLPPAILNTLTEYEEHRLLENVRKGRSIYSIKVSFSLATFDQELAELTEMLKKEGEVISTLPSAGGSLESHIDFELLFGSDKEERDLTNMVDRDNLTIKRLGTGKGAKPKKEAASKQVKETKAETSLPLVAEPVTPQVDDQSLSAKSISRTVRVDIAKLDELMNIVGELVLSHSAISGLVTRMRASGIPTYPLELNKAAILLHRKLNELQKGVMDIRMIPVVQLFEKMSRIVRKVSREQGKKIDLKTFGADTVLDKLIVEDISDPVMHIIRNSIDHGIESPEERLQAGKSERGVIKLSSYQKGNYVVIEVQDDGRGIDLDRVRAKGVEKGLLRSIEGVSDREALELIFLPGFSTNDTVSEISGRGVGMDVVKNNLSAISGMVDIDTEK